MLEPPRRGSSNKYPQCMFCIKNKEIGYTPVNSIFFIKVGYVGVYISRTHFHDGIIAFPYNKLCMSSTSVVYVLNFLQSAAHLYCAKKELFGLNLITIDHKLVIFGYDDLS